MGVDDINSGLVRAGKGDVPVSQQELVLGQMTDLEKGRVKEIANQINLSDSQFILQFGVSSQAKISRFADKVLSDIRTRDSGAVGDILQDLMMRVKDMNIDELSAPSGSFLAKIPFLGSLVNSVEKFITRYEKISVHIQSLINNLDMAKMELLKDIVMFDHLYEKNVEYFKELNLYIAAGEMKLKELQEQVIPEMKLRAQQSVDPMDAQKLNDLAQMVNRFEKKLYDLKLSKTISIQTAPQIRLIQNNDQVLVEKIQSSILNTIPLWKNQIVIAIGLHRQNKALELQKEVSQTTNALLLKNAEMLKIGSIETAKESEKGIVEIETLKKVNADLIATLEETLKIQQEGKLKRQLAETELANIENDLKKKLASMG